MKQLAKEMLISAVIGFLLPGVMLNYGARVRRSVQMPVQTEAVASMPVSVRNPDGTVTAGEMEPYLVGVVLAEMPVSFEPEALKAQAVVARTYARKAHLTGGKHGDGSVCREAECCQGYRSEEEYRLQGGGDADIKKVRDAVISTAGQVLTYEGELIEATYFSCSGGRTEEAVAVWGTDFPYLRSVDSPGEENAAGYQDEVTLPKREVEDRLGVILGEIPLTDITYTAGGGVDTITLGEKVFEGTEVRQKLGLRSTAFNIAVRDDQVIITTKGYGHRVGMSQYGADAMALEGADYKEILAHYYPGTEMVTVENG